MVQRQIMIICRDKEKFIQTQHDIRVVGDDIYVDVMAYKRKI